MNMSSNTVSAPHSGSNNTRLRLTTVESVFVALAALFVFGRFFSRHLNHLYLGADDWTILAALLLTVALYILTIVAANYGIGKHLSDVSPADVVKASRIQYGLVIVYSITPGMVKLSLLLLYKRTPIQRRFIIALWIVDSIIAMWVVSLCFAAVFNCFPIAGYWNHAIPARCIDFKKYATGLAVVGISTDIVVWLLPIPMIWRLHLDTEQKVALTAILLLGLL